MNTVIRNHDEYLEATKLVIHLEALKRDIQINLPTGLTRKARKAAYKKAKKETQKRIEKTESDIIHWRAACSRYRMQYYC